MIGLAALLLLGALLIGRQHLWLGWWAMPILVSLVAVRLWALPVFTRHQYDGHEADHLSWFLEATPPAAADTLHYPLMQEWWWLCGVLLPADPRLPIILSAVIGALGVAALAGSIGLLAGRRAGAAALLVVGLHPEHIAWSSSAYNVILPNTLAAVGLLGVSLGRKLPESRWPLVLSAASLALAISGRLELIVAALPCGMLALSGEGSVVERLRRWLPVLVVGGLLAAPGLLAVIGAGPLPGAEERPQSFSNNLMLLDYHAPYHQPLGGLLLLVGLIASARCWPRVTLALAPLVVVNHLLMAGFDDYGARHVLPSLLGIAWVLSAGAAALPRLLGGSLVLGALGLSVAGIFEMRDRFYGGEEAFMALLDGPAWAALPRWNEPPDEDCGWIAEDERVAAEPVRSHFNLLSASEADRLRGADGCLRWCLDAQDWRWSSRGVRDRAIRLSRLYDLHAEAVVLEQTSGYACLVMRVGERSTGASPLAEWHGRGHSADTRIP
ncbi:MAG: hypothetical protein P8R54_11620 [Myxococcota bacterium]|nr:hypothetical protein [Myxococcota bacterium]